MTMHFVNMSSWFRVPSTNQLKWDNAGLGEVTINNAATVHVSFKIGYFDIHIVLQDMLKYGTHFALSSMIYLNTDDTKSHTARKNVFDFFELV